VRGGRESGSRDGSFLGIEQFDTVVGTYIRYTIMRNKNTCTKLVVFNISFFILFCYSREGVGVIGGVKGSVKRDNYNKWVCYFALLSFGQKIQGY
jgi:hypothetical protein